MGRKKSNPNIVLVQNLGNQRGYAHVPGVKGQVDRLLG
jgi:hypothetical protein